jgi:alpha-beta hydrolase superfamily lysophospholipase
MLRTLLLGSLALIAATASQAATIPIQNWTAAQLQASLGPLPIKSSGAASAFKLNFAYKAERGHREYGSGMAILPDGPIKGIVLFLPGSNFVRDRAASQPDAENGVTEAAVFASNGFAVLIPDYPGLGETLRPQAFTLTGINITAIRAMLAQARREPALAGLAAHAQPLFVMGFSQGGQLAVALHADLERRAQPGFQHRATMAVAAPLDFVGMMERRLQASDPFGRLLFAGAVWAHAVAADVPLDQVFAPPIARRISWWMDGGHDPMALLKALPTTTAAMLNPQFTASFLQDRNHWFRRSLAANSPLNLVPRTPLRLVAGAVDPIVEAAATRPLYDSAKAKGGNITWVEVPGADHMGAAASSFGPALDWFTSFAR